MRKMNSLFTALAVAIVSAPAFAGPRVNFEAAAELADRPIVTDKQIGEIAGALNASSYLVLFKNESDHVMDFGAGLMQVGGDKNGFIVVSGEALPSGVYWNYTSEPVFIGEGDGEPGFELPAGGLVVIGSATTTTELSNQQSAHLVAADNPGVSCRDGYYACCIQGSGGSSRRAICVQDGQSAPGGATCTHGGPGASSCSFAGDVSSIAIADLTGILVQ